MPLLFSVGLFFALVGEKGSILIVFTNQLLDFFLKAMIGCLME